MKVLGFKKFLFLIIVLGGAVTSCQNRVNNETSTSKQTDCRTIEHEAGETEVCGRPQKIVVLGPYVLEPYPC